MSFKKITLFLVCISSVLFAVPTIAPLDATVQPKIPIVADELTVYPMEVTFCPLNDFDKNGNCVPDKTEYITKLYIATFNRAPDAKGLSYWVNSGIAIEQMAKYFFNSSEVQIIYPPGSTVRDFVKAVYGNLFNRLPEQAGEDYWTEQIEKGNITRSVLILYAINTDTENDANILENKTKVALAFVGRLGEKSNISSVSLASDPAYLASIKILVGINADPETAVDAIRILDSIKNNTDPINDILNH